MSIIHHAVTKEALAKAEPRVAPIRILLVDDHPILRKGMAQMLSDEQDILVVGEASDGQEGVRMALDLDPDVVLMDISMPVLDGIAATRIIHEHRPEIRVIGLSMFEELECSEILFAAGAIAYVCKTESIEKLVATIRSS